MTYRFQSVYQIVYLPNIHSNSSICCLIQSLLCAIWFNTCSFSIYCIVSHEIFSSYSVYEIWRNVCSASWTISNISFDFFWQVNSSLENFLGRAREFWLLNVSLWHIVISLIAIDTWSFAFFLNRQRVTFNHRFLSCRSKLVFIKFLFRSSFCFSSPKFLAQVFASILFERVEFTEGNKYRKSDLKMFCATKTHKESLFSGEKSLLRYHINTFHFSVKIISSSIWNCFPWKDWAFFARITSLVTWPDLWLFGLKIGR